jgi:Uma2 family endonuclease
MTTMNPIAAPRERIFEPEDLLRMPNSKDYELVDGKLVERKMGSESSWIAGLISFLLQQFLRGKKLGHVLVADASYQCYPDAPKKVRKPDVSVVRYGRLQGERVPKGHVPIAPDLVVEVVSPRDLAEQIEVKVLEYLAAGVQLVWVVYPSSRRVWVRRPATAVAGPATELTGEDTISGEDVIPGFSCKVSEFFEEP